MCCNYHPILSQRCTTCRDKGAHRCSGCGSYTATYSKLPDQQVSSFAKAALQAEQMGKTLQSTEWWSKERATIEAYLNALMALPCPTVKQLLEECWANL